MKIVCAVLQIMYCAGTGEIEFLESHPTQLNIPEHEQVSINGFCGPVSGYAELL